MEYFGIKVKELLMAGYSVKALTSSGYTIEDDLFPDRYRITGECVEDLVCEAFDYVFNDSQ